MPGLLISADLLLCPITARSLQRQQRNHTCALPQLAV